LLESTSSAEFVREAFNAALRPEQRLTVSEWADKHRVLSNKASAEPGFWRTSRVPFMREPMDVMSPSSSVERIVLMAGTQIGKTESLNNKIGHTISHSPGPMLMVQPTLDMARKVSKQRIAPMIEETPVLRALVREPRERDSGNTVMVKEFDGGVLMMTGANSAAGLKSMPIRDLLMDEVDSYPGDVEGEGDPIVMAEKRTDTFKRRRRIMLVSTPTLEGISRIEIEFMRGDRRRYYIPCPKCGHMDFLTWSGADEVTKIAGTHHRIEWEGIHADDSDADTAHMVCSGCGSRIAEWNKEKMLAAGEWRPTVADYRGNTASYHISSLYSPFGWKSWANCVREFLDAKRDPFQLRAWVNTVLGETWREPGARFDADILAERCEMYEAEVPAGVGILTASVDVQGDRLEVLVKGWGEREESWLIMHTVIIGDPAQEKPWIDLTSFLVSRFEHQSGRRLGIELATIDSGGHHTEQVYKYCKAMEGKNVFAIKGSSQHGMPLVSRPTQHNRYRVSLYNLGTDTGKDMIYGRLRVHDRGPLFMHMPMVDREYLEQLCSERSVVKYIKGKGATREWVKIRERNEALDLEVYALAALHILGLGVIKTLGDRARAWSVPLEEKNPSAIQTTSTTRRIVPPAKFRKPFATSW